VPDVTVAVPSYNHALFVERTLRSIFAQTFPPKKLIVIDDGSKDESAAVIDRVLKDCPFAAEFIARENRGLCATLNEALAITSTDYFAYISSDDLWFPRFLESRAEALSVRPGAVIAYGYSFLVDENDTVTDSTRRWGEYADGNALGMLLYPMIPASASVLYRRGPLAECGWNEDSILEDYELYLRLSARGEFALDNSEPLSAWRIHATNTSADFGRMMNEWLVAQRRTMNETGLSEPELARIQSELKFRCVADFLRRGDRRTAWALFTENAGAADSAGSVLKTALRFLVPLSYWRKRPDSRI
jgi:alpha-1,3-rhamnosyltransferase